MSSEIISLRNAVNRLIDENAELKEEVKELKKIARKVNATFGIANAHMPICNMSVEGAPYCNCGVADAIQYYKRRESNV